MMGYFFIILIVIVLVVTTLTVIVTHSFIIMIVIHYITFIRVRPSFTLSLIRSFSNDPRFAHPNLETIYFGDQELKRDCAYCKESEVSLYLIAQFGY